MGAAFSILRSIRRVIFSNLSGIPLEEPPICYLRAEDYAITGLLRECVQEKWNHALKSMIYLNLHSRHLLWPIIQKRMDRMEASLKYTNCDLLELHVMLPGWPDKKIFEVHDLFQAFEVDGDGLIEIAEMSVGLDNLGDNTPKKDRIPQLCASDEDGTGSIDFEEFLTILYEQQEVLHSETMLSQTFMKVNKDIKVIRWMSTVQQIQAGYL